MSDKKGIMVCRDASAPMKPGYVLGHKCDICGTEVQISPTGVPRMKELFVLCMRCGIVMKQKLDNAGAKQDVQFGPGALETMKEIFRGKQ